MNRYPNSVTGLLSNFCADFFTYAEYVAYRPVRVFHTHVDDASVIWFTIKSRVYLDAALSELGLDIKWRRDIRAVNIGDFLYDRFKVVYSIVHKLYTTLFSHITDDIASLSRLYHILWRINNPYTLNDMQM